MEDRIIIEKAIHAKKRNLALIYVYYIYLGIYVYRFI